MAKQKKASEVFFSDLRIKGGDNLLKKFDRLITEAGIDRIDFTDKYVAVKIHFGEWGNMAFLRQQYAKVLCDHIKARGGKPFLTDCNTLYPGYRNNALGHLDVAMLNGYSPLSTGVQNIIADGLRGTDERIIKVEGGKYVKKAKIGAAVAEADILISLTHFKGHISAGFGGALKNIGMGCGSKHGKMEMHSEGTPVIRKDLCIGCGMCVKNCNNDGVKIVRKKAVINTDKCVGCGHCFAYCPKGAIDSAWDIAKPVLSCKIAEYTKAAINGKPNFHISFVTDVSPFCDCDPGNDMPIVPDIGMFASFDPVALDEACADAVNRQPVIQGSYAWKKILKYAEANNLDAARIANSPDKDTFKLMQPVTDWEAGQEHAEKLGIGTRQYKINEIK